MGVYISPPGFFSSYVEITFDDGTLIHSLEERSDLRLPGGVLFVIFIFGEED
jgi:hypothetical protein